MKLSFQKNFRSKRPALFRARNEHWFDVAQVGIKLPKISSEHTLKWSAKYKNSLKRPLNCINDKKERVKS